MNDQLSLAIKDYTDQIADSIALHYRVEELEFRLRDAQNAVREGSELITVLREHIAFLKAENARLVDELQALKLKFVRSQEEVAETRTRLAFKDQRNA